MDFWPALLASETITEGITLVGAFGLVVGALVWFLKHLVEKTIPEERNIFREELKAQRDTFTAALRQMDEHHQAIMEELRAMRAAAATAADATHEQAARDRIERMHKQYGPL